MIGAAGFLGFAFSDGGGGAGVLEALTGFDAISSRVASSLGFAFVG